jgi:hypothetical protein
MTKKFLPRGGLQPRVSTSFGAFEKRGDPWINRREQERDFGRNLETENPERDWWNLYTGDIQATAARVAGLKLFGGEPDKRTGERSSRDPERIRAVNIVRTMKEEMRPRSRSHADSKDNRSTETSGDDRANEMNGALTKAHKELPTFGSTGNMFKTSSKPKRKILSIRKNDLTPRETLKMKLGGKDD